MSDLIDRQRAIDVVDRYFKFIELNGDICIDGLKMLPSAQPKKGKWIVGANHGLGVKTLTCSECGYVEVSSHILNFCPNCGARMEGEEDE